MFQLAYHSDVRRIDIPALSPDWRKKIQHAIETKLQVHPDVYGKPLRKSLKGYRKLRVGDYRVVFRIKGKRIFVLCIQHRSVVYKVVQQR